MPTNPLIIITCGKSKRPTESPAWRMYTGTYFKMQMRWAIHTAATAQNIRILSAKYGLIPLDTIIHPYDLRMGQPGSITAQQLRTQLDALTPTPTQILTTASSTYLQTLRESTNIPINAPFEHSGSMGQKMSAIKHHIQTH